MLNLLRIWVVFSAALSAGGWVLSAFGCLNRAGYALLLFATALALLPFLRLNGTFSAAKWQRRFRRPAPLLYLVLAVLCAIGALLYLPVNIDGYSYRIPRVLHWLWTRQWHWIHTADVRLNVVATGFDWLSAPLLLFFKTERAIPLINIVSFLLLPGAVYMTLHRIGVSKRTAWWWMWILPAGFCYFMQAGSIANDMYAAVYTLAAIGFALRAGEMRATSAADLFVSVLALALATGAKQTNIPFALPWFIAAIPAFRLLRNRVFPTAGIAILALFASIIPISVLNLANGFPWQGFAAGRDYAPPNAFWGVVGNAFWVAFSNLQPPIIPWAGRWNVLREQFIASDAGRPFRSFEAFGYLHRAASEQYSGIGCTVLLLLLATWIATRRRNASRRSPMRIRCVRITIWLGFFVFLAKVGINQCPRYLAPYYPFLAASLLCGERAAEITRNRLWKVSAFAVIALSIALAILSRQRPLFPASTVISALENRFGNKPFLAKLAGSYNFAESLRVQFDPILSRIPPEQPVVGYAVRMGDKEPWLWQPLFHRRVIRILNSDTPEQLRRLGINYAVVDPSALTTVHDQAIVVELDSPRARITSIDEWLKAFRAELVFSSEISISPELPPDRIYLVRLRQNSSR